MNLFEYSKPKLSEKERLFWIEFLMMWLQGKYMKSKKNVADVIWERFFDTFKPRYTSRKKLYRVVTLPIQYADIDHFHLNNPAVQNIASWTSTKYGMDSVAGVATDINTYYTTERNTCRVAISAIIEPQYILASYSDLKSIFMWLTHDWEYNPKPSTYRMVDGMKHWDAESFHPYLGNEDDEFHQDLGFYIGTFRDYAGGPHRQYEFIIRTHPVDAVLVKVYRKGKDILDSGNDDPHN